MFSKFIISFLFLVTCKVAGFAQNSPIIIPTSHNEKILRIVIDQQGKYFYTGDKWKIIMWDFKTMKQLFTFHVANKSLETSYGDKVENYKNLTISPDGNILAYTTEKNTLQIYSTLSGKLIRTIHKVNSRLSFSKDSKIIYHLAVGPLLNGSNTPDGRMVQSVNIASGFVNDYWHFKEFNDWGVYNNYFFPLKNSQVLNFNKNGYQVLDLDNKKEFDTYQISEEAKKKFQNNGKAFNENFFEVLAEPGLFYFQQHRNGKLGWVTWDIFENKEFAFFPSYAEINFQQSFNAENVLYSTKSSRFGGKQEVVVFSQGYKIEKKKINNASDEMSVAALCKKSNTIIYADLNQNLYTANLDNGEKKIVARSLPNINKFSFYREGNMLSFNGTSPAIDPGDPYATHYNFNANYAIDLSNAALRVLDTFPSKPFSTILPVKLTKDSFLLQYNQFNSDILKLVIYDKKSKKNLPLVLKDFEVSEYGSSDFSKLPRIFTLTTPNIVYYSAGSFELKNRDEYNYNLFRYSLETKQAQKIFTSPVITNEKWESLGGTANNRPYAVKQLIIDKESEILVSAENDFKGSVNLIDIKSGKILAKQPFAFDSLTLKNNINKQTFQNIGNTYRPFNLIQVKRLKNDVVRVLASEYMYDFNLANGSVKEEKIIDGTMFDNKYNVKIFGDQSLENIFVSYEDENESVVKTVYGPNKIKLDHITSTVKQFEFTQNDSILYTINADNSINIYSAITGKYYGSLYTFENSKDWVFVGVDGRFDGTEKGMEKLYYLKQREVISIDKVYEKYYTPNLYLRLIAGEKFDPLPEIDLKPKPKTKILYAEKQRNLEVEDDIATYTNTTGLAEITVDATAEEDKVDEIRLFHNGKVVNLATRGLFVTDADGTERKKYTINLLPGNNNFRAIALNSQRTESDGDEIVVNYNVAANNAPVVVKPVNNNAAVVSAVNKDATLHLIVVGINEYQNKTMSLNYAMADATSFKEEVEKDAKTILGNIKTYFVTNNTADKAGITNAFKKVQQNAKAQDVFIFYYAGHGVIGKDKEFYLVPTDVSDLKNVQTELEQKGIASKLLQQYAVDIQAQKQLFILDACQSAGAFEKLLSNDGDQQKSIAVVSRSTGTHWMAASGAMQYANEFSSLGHGVFTYVLLQALKGEAAANKMITVNGLKSFLQVQVPLLMKKYNGSAQLPASYGVGNDFPVEVMK